MAVPISPLVQDHYDVPGELVALRRKLSNEV